MNYITLILVIAILFGLSDFFTSHVPQLQRIIYVIAAITIYTLFTIKYFYGADMLHYYNYYIYSRTPEYVISHPNKGFFEPGYTFLSSIFFHYNVPFYWFTAFISTLYFSSVFLLWRLIPRYRSFALMLLVCLDYNLIFAAFRQCISVSFFIFMVLCLRDKRYILALLCAFLTALMHKSGAFAVGVSLAFYMLQTKTLPQWVYPTLLLLLLLLLFIPMSNLLFGAIKTLHLPSHYLYSLRHHFSLGKRVQIVFVLYLMLLVCLAHYRQYVNTQMTTIASFVIIGVLFIVLLYQSYYILNRIRSYFLPLIITYVFRLVQQAEDKQIKVPYGKLIKQLAVVVAFVYIGHMTYTFTRDANKMKYKIYNACTVFDIIGQDKQKVQQKQLKQAKLWWKYEFRQGLKKNKVTSL